MKAQENLLKVTSFKLSLSSILMAVLLTLSSSVNATVYYFSSSTGNDSYNILEARNPATPWKSLHKLNQIFINLGSGDSVLFKRGDVFCGAITVSRSGGVFSPIYLGAYGKGKNPEISGFTTLNNWKLVKNGIYESACNAAGSSLVINGIQKAMGRYPNTGYLTFESHNENNSITDNELTDNINWTGAEAVIRKNRWVIDRSTITNHTGSTLTYATGTKSAPTNGYGYFIQKSVKTLDQFGEWFYDETRKTMMVYFGNKNPNSFNVTTPIVNNLVDIKRFNYVTFENLTFKGAGNNTFNIVLSRKITLKNCNIDMTGAEAVFANYSPFLTVENCKINHSLSSALNFDAGCTNSVINNNHIQNTGLFAGAGKSGTGTYEAITSFGDNTVIEKNVIDSVGYNGIYFGGNSSLVKNNYITYFCLTKDDGAGIYVGDWSKTNNKKIIDNIVLHGVGNAMGGGRYPSLQAEGIYIDDNSESVVITGNTVALCSNNGIKVHNAKEISIYNNNVVNNGVQLRLEQDHYLATSSFIRNNQIKNNNFLSTNIAQSTVKLSTHQDDIKDFGQIDSNFYYQPATKSASIVAATVKNGRTNQESYNLSNWKSISGKDRSSIESSADAVLFEYNASNTAKVVTLKNRYVDAQNRVYSGKMHIDSFSSVVLMLADKPVVKSDRLAVIRRSLIFNKNKYWVSNQRVKNDVKL